MMIRIPPTRTDSESSGPGPGVVDSDSEPESESMPVVGGPRAEQHEVAGPPVWAPDLGLTEAWARSR